MNARSLGEGSRRRGASLTARPNNHGDSQGGDCDEPFVSAPEE